MMVKKTVFGCICVILCIIMLLTAAPLSGIRAVLVPKLAGVPYSSQSAARTGTLPTDNTETTIGWGLYEPIVEIRDKLESGELDPDAVENDESLREFFEAYGNADLEDILDKIESGNLAGFDLSALKGFLYRIIALSENTSETIPTAPVVDTELKGLIDEIKALLAEGTNVDLKNTEELKGLFEAFGNADIDEILEKICAGDFGGLDLSAIKGFLRIIPSLLSSETSDTTIYTHGTTTYTHGTTLPQTTVHTHIYQTTQVLSRPDCTNAGSLATQCSCGSTTTRILPALGHAYYPLWIADTPATADTQGSESRHCTREGCTAVTDVRAVPAHASQVLTPVTNPYIKLASSSDGAKILVVGGSDTSVQAVKACSATSP